MLKSVALFVTTLAISVACGGGNGSSSSGGGDGADGQSSQRVTSTSVPAGGTTGGARTPTSVPAGGTTGATTTSPGARTGVVRLGNQSFEFALQCQVAFGAIGGSRRPRDGSDISFSFSLVPQNIGPSSLRIDDKRVARPVDLRAGGDVVQNFAGFKQGDSQIDTFTITGRGVSGNATLIDVFAMQLSLSGQVPFPQPVKATFAINCND